jgi:hypothetical protein
MNIKLVLLSSVTVATTACAHVSTNFTRLDPTIRLARTCPDAVRLYTGPGGVEQPYREVALINSAGDVTLSDEGAMFFSMRQAAAIVGANGVILGGIDEPNAITKVAADVAKTTAVRKGKAMAIYVPADSAHAVAACANYKAPSWLHRVFIGA